MEDLVRGAAKAPFAKEAEEEEEDHDSKVHGMHCCEGVDHHNHDHSHSSYDHDHRSGHHAET